MLRKALSWRVWAPSWAVFFLVTVLASFAGARSVLFGATAAVLTWVVLMYDDRYARSCPWCRRPVRGGAAVCGSCGREV